MNRCDAWCTIGGSPVLIVLVAGVIVFVVLVIADWWERR